ncbi:carboxypeptidase-like regulatory domain-containing protein [Polaribacter sp. NJDZ03]|uniref:TonB-dependent receptor n=1 Tax=Polaribacter sp. NJDZ03 TaxID=2855841 RepID=UPI001C4A11D9|nr:carboxypeptidase-like regulatory domain-containing protein [Polaribacter sp. NJDZ03]
MQKQIFFFFLILSLNIFSQEDKLKETSLKKVLTTIETKFHIKFAYANHLIKGKSIVFNIDDKKIAAIILELKRAIHLDIKEVSDNRFLIVLPPKEITICGQLQNANNITEKLRGASIKIKGTNIGVLSNNEGKFSFSNIETSAVLEVSFIGFKTIDISLHAFIFEDCLLIPMQEEATFLEEIIITNYLTNSISKTIDGAIVFRPKNQNVLPGLTEPDVLQSVQQLPGILNVDETASGLHVRGGTPDQNLILFDGIKLFNTGHFFGAISALNPYIIDKVTVYRTASNSKYGNHIAGVVDVETSSDIATKISGSAGFNFTHVDANLKVPIDKKVSAILSVRRSIADIVRTPTIDKLSNKAFQHSSVTEDAKDAEEYNVISDNDFKFIDYNLKINYKPTENDLLSISQIGILNNFDYNFLNLDLEEKRSDHLKLKNLGYSTHWNRKWTEKFSQNLNVSYSKYNLNYNNLKTSNDLEYAEIEKRNEVANFEVKLDFLQTIGEFQQMKYGYQYGYQDISYFLERENSNQFSGTKLTLDTNSNNIHTLFSEYSYNFKKKYALKIGVRGNYFSSIDTYTLEPRIFMQINVLPKFWLNSSFEVKQQNISKLLEFDTIDFGLENQLWALSNNEEIPLLESNQLTFGALYSANNFTIDVDLYRRKIKGLTTLTTGFDSFIQEIYTGEAVTIGLDLLIKKTWHNFDTWVSYNTGSSSFTFSELNEGEEFSGNFDVSHSFYWSNNFKYKSFTFSTGFSYRVGIPFSSSGGQDDNFGIIRNGINDDRLPNYHRLDFSSTYDFRLNKKVKAKIGLSLLNIYNQENILKREYESKRTTGFNDVLVKNDTKSQGFTPNFFFRVSF